MKNKFILIPIVTAFLTLPILAPVAFSEDEAKPGMQDQMSMPPEMQAKFAEAKVKGQPNENHKILDPIVGDFEATSKMWMSPDAQPMESKATATNKWILGGRFVHQDYKGEWQGETFEGMGITGYDNVKESYQSLWLDNMMTGIMLSDGKYDAAAKTLTFEGTFSCPMTGKKDMKMRSVLKIMDNDTHVYEMYGQGMTGEGPEFKTMEITYKRK
jgi:hypothetical protein